MRTQWFMQDVEMPLTAKVVLDFLHQTSGETVNISLLGTAPRLWTHLATSRPPHYSLRIFNLGLPQREMTTRYIN
jgi:hypothetical protein